MQVAILGCGYVASQYAATLSRHPELQLRGVYDRDVGRRDGSARRLGVTSYASLDAMLADTATQLVINLTNPRAHFDSNRACLEAGKHVYCEKPLAMTARDAGVLAAIAGERGLALSSAPCSVLADAAQTLWRAVRRRAAGSVLVVYAQFDDGLVAPHQSPWTWTNDAGVPWPARDEFETGSTFQHGGYVLTWLCAMFGPALRVTSFASVQVKDKGIAVDQMAPDFTVGCIEFGDGIVARVTCGLSAPRDKSITIVGDRGTLSVGNVRDDRAPVMWRPVNESRLESIVRRRARPLHRWLQARIGDAGVGALFATNYLPVATSPDLGGVSADKPVDFLRGPSEMVSAIEHGRPPRLSAAFGVHLVELVERLQYPERFADRTVLSTFAPIAPMDWAI